MQGVSGCHVCFSRSELANTLATYCPDDAFIDVTACSILVQPYLQEKSAARHKEIEKKIALHS